MSGIEIAGLVLGVVPIVIEILKSYRITRDRLITFKNHAQIASETDKTRSEFHDSGIGSAKSVSAPEHSVYAASVVSSRADASHKRLPPLPKIARNGQSFTCGICDRVVTIRSKTLWRTHVFEDICAYTCIFTACPMAGLLFEDYKAMTSHLEARHCKTPGILDTLCPLCHEHVHGPMSSASIHLARHMEEIALGVIPHSADMDDDSDGSSQPDEGSAIDFGTLAQEHLSSQPQLTTPVSGDGVTRAEGPPFSTDSIPSPMPPSSRQSTREHHQHDSSGKDKDYPKRSDSPDSSGSQVVVDNITSWTQEKQQDRITTKDTPKQEKTKQSISRIPGIESRFQKLWNNIVPPRKDESSRKSAGTKESHDEQSSSTTSKQDFSAGYTAGSPEISVGSVSKRFPWSKSGKGKRKEMIKEREDNDELSFTSDTAFNSNTNEISHETRPPATAPLEVAQPKNPNAPKPGAYTCECCPKKPKRFDTEEELRLHGLEKSYTCSFCPELFRTKKEAEGHQSSVHPYQSPSHTTKGSSSGKGKTEYHYFWECCNCGMAVNSFDLDAVCSNGCGHWRGACCTVYQW